MHRFSGMGIIVVFFATILSGCAATPKMDYKPTAISSAPRNISVYVKSFEDARPAAERGVLGGVYNGYNMRLNDVVEPAGMIDSLKKSLENELKVAGYNLVQDESDLVLNAALESASCNTGNSGKANLKIRFKILDKNQEVLNDLYMADGKQGFLSMDISCTEPLIDSIRKIMAKFIGDLNKYVQS